MYQFTSLREGPSGPRSNANRNRFGFFIWELWDNMGNLRGCEYGSLSCPLRRGWRSCGAGCPRLLSARGEPSVTLSLGHEHDEQTREVDMPRRGIAVAVVVILVSLIVLGLTSSFLVDWAWFSAVGYLDVFWTLLGGKAVLFFAVFAGSAVLLWLNGYLAHRFARRQGRVRCMEIVLAPSKRPRPLR
jgi:hypothetical protein